MLHEFLDANRPTLIARCLEKLAQRPSTRAAGAELEFGVPVFLDEVIRTLRLEQGASPMQSRRVSGKSGGTIDSLSEIGETAAAHGRELMAQGYTIEQVVHDYGDLCQAITDLAFERKLTIQIDEFRTLNRCLDNAIAGAVTEFSYQRDTVAADRQAAALNHRIGYFAHELRNLLNTATLALTVLKDGPVGLNGATGAVLDRSLVGLRNLIDRSLADVKMAAGLPLRSALFSLSEFIAEVNVSASLEAGVRNCQLLVLPVDPGLAVAADRDLLLAAVGNLLQNAFKFTREGTQVRLSAYASADRILIDVEDCCGGLPAGSEHRLFVPFSQDGVDRSGLGLGLSISRASVEANSGVLRMKDLPGHGCVFTIDMPRKAMPPVGQAQVAALPA
jgi:signal transduction histidine kinase